MIDPTLDSVTVCEHCKRRETAEGHDGCLGELPGVIFACCGHGNRALSYIYFENGVCVRGFDVVYKEPQETADIAKAMKDEIYSNCGKFKYA